MAANRIGQHVRGALGIGIVVKVPADVGVVIVTHNSEKVVRRCVEALTAGELVPTKIVVVDNASRQPEYVDELARDFAEVEALILAENVGFCAGNNRGVERLDPNLHVSLINPDAFVSAEFLIDAVHALETGQRVGAVGPKLLGADPATGQPTGLIDSAGIGQTRWGRYYDRGQGQPDRGQYDVPGQPAALCAAAVMLHRDAVRALTHDRRLFDERFFMYKEDLDLSFRLRRAGWRTVYEPSLTVLHCRGWQDRKSMPIWARRRSLVNEWRLWRRGWTPERSRWAALPYLLAKTVAVALGR